MARPKRTKESSSAGVLVKVAVLLPFVAALVFLVASTWIERSDARAVAAWDDLFGTLEERLQRYPQRSVNREALEVERLAQNLGISLASPLDQPGRSFDDEADEIVNNELESYVSTQLSRDDLTVASPPERAAEYLRERATALDLMRNYLATHATPHWGRDLERILGGRHHNPLGHRRVQTLLLADALAALASGERALALENLEASWSLLNAVRDDVSLYTNNHVLWFLQQQAATVRLIEDPPRIWYERLDPQALIEPANEVLKHNGWLWSHVDDTMRWDPQVSLLQRFANIGARPYVQLCEIDMGVNYRSNVKKLLELDYLCDRDLEAAGVRLDWPVPWWNQMEFVSVSVRDYVDLWRRVMFDLEGTRKLIDARGHVALAELEQSVVCPQDRWTQTRNLDGTRRLTFSRTLMWPPKGSALPLTYAFKLDDGSSY